MLDCMSKYLICLTVFVSTRLIIWNYVQADSSAGKGQVHSIKGKCRFIFTLSTLPAGGGALGSMAVAGRKNFDTLVS